MPDGHVLAEKLGEGSLADSPVLFLKLDGLLRSKSDSPEEAEERPSFTESFGSPTTSPARLSSCTVLEMKKRFGKSLLRTPRLCRHLGKSVSHVALCEKRAFQTF